MTITAFHDLCRYMAMLQTYGSLTKLTSRKMEKKKKRKMASLPIAAKLLQSCPTLCDPIESSPPGSPVPGILQARTLEWVAISFSNAWKGKVKVKSLNCVQLLATSWTVAHQAPPSMGFSRQEYWSGMPLPSPPIKSGKIIVGIAYHSFHLLSGVPKTMSIT